MDSCVGEADQIMFRDMDIPLPKHKGKSLLCYMAFTNLLLKTYFQ